MKQKLLDFLKIYLPFVVVLFVIQYLVVNYALDVELYYSTWSIYTFHLFASFFMYATVLFVHLTFSEKTGFAFIAFSFLKMLAALLFLLPMLLSDSPSKFTDMIVFFIPYFLFLIFETGFVVKIINEK